MQIRLIRGGLGSLCRTVRQARWLASRDEARLWAESYEGDDWLAIRAEIAKADPVPPNDFVFE